MSKIPDPARTEPMADAVLKLLAELGATPQEASIVLLTSGVNQLYHLGVPEERAALAVRALYKLRKRETPPR